MRRETAEKTARWPGATRRGRRRPATSRWPTSGSARRRSAAMASAGPGCRRATDAFAQRRQQVQRGHEHQQPTKGRQELLSREIAHLRNGGDDEAQSTQSEQPQPERDRVRKDDPRQILGRDHPTAYKSDSAPRRRIASRSRRCWKSRRPGTTSARCGRAEGPCRCRRMPAGRRTSASRS